MGNIKLAVINNKNTIVELLNKVTIQLHKKGINQWAYPWNLSEIEKDIIKECIYVIEMDNLIVGTFSIKETSKMDFPIADSEGKYLYRIALLPEYQGKGLGLEIINFTFQYSLTLKKSLYLDCWAGNQKLRSFYSNAGFDYIGDFPEDDYMISIFKYFRE